MYLKRFVELFIVYLISFVVGSFVYGIAFVTTNGLLILAGGLIGYCVLVIPLTIMTIRKMTKRATASGEHQPAQSRFNQVLAALPSYFYLATSDQTDQVSNSIVTFAQSEHHENVFYVATDPRTKRVQNILVHEQVAIASLADSELGLRFSSNHARARVIKGKPAITKLLKTNPTLTGLSANLSNQAILEITLTSVLIESFRDAPEIVQLQQQKTSN
ncbi:pyridoxamine 5'-phosphate oxidase family protein [Fructilactobacillus myrtifloralis]|uniref:Pyridoxamine 5'-phosphate oxidase family protein n=1 Tax=Fructilactobacillus myrtifloralis TaxID=2940301 RepID=A0ABY5BQ09_9LACO|nr:pyridoxamine 5'-phosphate oxidase family protein [Fructilactobacillus myrtifloralis]USS85345.1 pyridoxamine 5'-phosphate oxidase family protein [Fructilactobacillus myrtifloralis]